MRYLYLHGFASSPASRKAQAFSRALEACGIALEIPALDTGDFERLTISSQLSVIESVLDGEPARLIGSSMGGYLAALYALVHPEIDRLVLLAPAFGFASRWREINGPDKIREWRDTGWMDVFHYGTGTMRRLDAGLLADAERYPGEPDFQQPALMFHGWNDTTVPVEFSRVFAASHSNVALTELDSDHELGNVLEQITGASVPFLTAKGS